MWGGMGATHAPGMCMGGMGLGTWFRDRRVLFQFAVKSDVSCMALLSSSRV